MSDIELVRNAGIHSAIIVDDGYDAIPQATELVEEESWDSFFDDSQGAEVDRIREFFPEYSPTDRENLKSSQDFIDALWANKATVGDLLGDLFLTYEQTIQQNNRFLDAVESTLESLEVSFTRQGRDFVESGITADLIIIDLFLGIQQGKLDREFTVDQLKEVIRRRGENPLPSIVLMSQVNGISDLAKEFRKDVKLHASAFRHIGKKDLAIQGRLKGQIISLAAHRVDSHALAKFVDTWETNTLASVQAAANSLRKIDIDDLQHIRSMLLRFEGLNTSSYIIDVFDRVLQYEIESHGDVIEAALPLDKMVGDTAPLMISEDRDTYAVIEQTLFVNPNRRAHATGAEWPVTFGDILAPRQGYQVRPRDFFVGRSDLVFFIASPACDLVRKGGLTTALLIAGSLQEIDMTKPDLGVTSDTTPIITMNDGSRFQINWNFNELRTVKLGQLKRLLHTEKGYATIAARLREGPAVNLRQQFLSSIGRVGELAPLPRSFRFEAKLHVPLKEGSTQPLVLPDGKQITGNILVHRPGRYATAIIDSNCEEDLTAALLNLDLDVVASRSKEQFKILKEQARLRQIFRSGFHGIALPLGPARNAGLLKPEEKQPESDSAKPKTDNVATIVDEENAGQLLENQNSKAGLIIVTHLQPVTQITT